MSAVICPHCGQIGRRLVAVVSEDVNILQTGGAVRRYPRVIKGLLLLAGVAWISAVIATDLAWKALAWSAVFWLRKVGRKTEVEFIPIEG